MKKLFIIISFLTCSLVTAQETKATIKEEGLQINWSILLSKLDTTKIKSGILIDKVTSFANLLFFNTEKHNTFTKQHFVQAMSELYRASNKSKFMDVKKLKEIIKTNTQGNQVLIGIINTNFEKLNS